MKTKCKTLYPNGAIAAIAFACLSLPNFTFASVAPAAETLSEKAIEEEIIKGLSPQRVVEIKIKNEKRMKELRRVYKVLKLHEKNLPGGCEFEPGSLSFDENAGIQFKLVQKCEDCDDEIAPEKIEPPKVASVQLKPVRYDTIASTSASRATENRAKNNKVGFFRYSEKIMNTESGWNEREVAGFFQGSASQAMKFGTVKETRDFEIRYTKKRKTILLLSIGRSDALREVDRITCQLPTVTF